MKLRMFACCCYLYVLMYVLCSSNTITNRQCDWFGSLSSVFISI
jgi:hypothetical protein